MDRGPFGTTPVRIGGGTVELAESGIVRLSLPPLRSGYANAQLDDTSGRARARLGHRPPFRLRVRARSAPADPAGTLGFGLWNDPFAFSLGFAGGSRRLPAAPQALWFFYGSPPNDLAYSEAGVPTGWKAASLRSPRLPGLLVAAGGIGLLALGPLPTLQGKAARMALRGLETAEARIHVNLAEWHVYELAWTAEGAEFHVDGSLVLHVDRPPDPPLGFVAWLDNQFAIISATAGVRFGVLPVTGLQALELADLVLEDS